LVAFGEAADDEKKNCNGEGEYGDAMNKISKWFG
jgi:hypothetical protein